MAAEVVRSALRSQTHLIFNRHLDQIMMCALYSVCKVGQLREVMFKDIVMCYQRLPHGTPGVFRNVVLQQTDALLVQERNDIIKFYNRVFMPSECAADAASRPQQAAPLRQQLGICVGRAVFYGVPL